MCPPCEVMICSIFSPLSRTLLRSRFIDPVFTMVLVALLTLLLFSEPTEGAAYMVTEGMLEGA